MARPLSRQLISQSIELIDGLREAMEAHHRWALSVHRLLLEPGSGPPANEHECAFGHWYVRAYAHPALHGHALFKAINPVHRTMHATAKALWETSGAEPAERPAAYQRFHESVRSFNEAVQGFERELWTQACLVDPLTGLRNRHLMLADLAEEQQRTERENRPCSVVLLDIDNFKALNDRHGHLLGDQLLSMAAECVLARLRLYDRAYRYGGEEFLLCLPDASVAQGQAIAERLRAEIDGLRLDVGEERLTITVSAGVAPLESGVTVEQIIARADQALFSAKRAGRNRIAVWERGE